jgi:hypothetical protein
MSSIIIGAGAFVYLMTKDTYKTFKSEKKETEEAEVA